MRLAACVTAVPQVAAGTGSNGTAAAANGTAAGFQMGVPRMFLLQPLSPGTMYDVYLVAADTAGNRQTRVTNITWVSLLLLLLGGKGPTGIVCCWMVVYAVQTCWGQTSSTCLVPPADAFVKVLHSSACMVNQHVQPQRLQLAHPVLLGRRVCVRVCSAGRCARRTHGHLSSWTYPLPSRRP